MTLAKPASDGRATALITGASYGVGRAVAISLARLGFNLLLNGRSEDHLHQTRDRCLAAGAATTVLHGDIRDTSIRAALVAAADRQGLDVWIHTASARPDPERQASLIDTTAAEIDDFASTIFVATAALLRELHPSLKRAAPARVIWFISDWAYRGSHGPPAFSATKAALAHLAHTCRRKLAGDGIHITSLFPGDIASFDKNWETPKWDIDDPLETVQDELGLERISLRDITDTVEFVITRKMARIEEIWLSPLDASYDY